MGIVVIGATFVDIKGFPEDAYIPTGRNVGRVEYLHGGVARNVVEDIANVELRPTFVSIVDDTPMGAAVMEKLRNHKRCGSIVDLFRQENNTVIQQTGENIVAALAAAGLLNNIGN